MRHPRSPLFAAFAVLVVVTAVPAQPDQPPPAGVVRKAAKPGTTAAVDQATADKNALQKAGLKESDPAGLLDYIRARTLSDNELTKIQTVIKRLGADDFEERLKAANEVERFGPAAVGPLRTAATSDTDYEIAYRSRECLRRLETVPHSEVAAAAVRALAQAKSPEAAKALLAFLPLADNQAVAEQIRATLTALAVRDGKPDPALLAALTDGTAVRRAAAAVALLEGGPAGERIRIKDAYPKVKAAALAETDADVKFQMLFPMLTVARDKDAVGPLIESLAELPRGRLWQAEDYLLQLAGKDAPKATLGRTKESLTKAKDAWKDWWSKAASTTGVEKFAFTPRVTGRTLVVLYDTRHGGPGAVAELGPDMKERWRIHNLSGPMDAQMLPDGNVVVAEQHTNRITVRNTRGDILVTRSIGGNNRVYGNPQHVQVLENGNYLAVCQNVVVELNKDKDEEVWRYVRNNYDVRAARRLPNGETLVFCQNGPNHCIFVDDKGKEIATKKLRTGMPNYQFGHMSVVSADRVLFAEMNQVAEYDLKENKSVWTKTASQPRSVQRLPNGNTLVVEGASTARMVEYAPDGEEVWSHQSTDGMQFYRAYRR